MSCLIDTFIVPSSRNRKIRVPTSWMIIDRRHAFADFAMDVLESIKTSIVGYTSRQGCLRGLLDSRREKGLLVR